MIKYCSVINYRSDVIDHQCCDIITCSDVTKCISAVISHRSDVILSLKRWLCVSDVNNLMIEFTTKILFLFLMKNKIWFTG